MSDISKCQGLLDGSTGGPLTCPVRQNCVRWLTTAGDRQSWIIPTEVGEKCQRYWPTDKEPNDDN